MLTPEEKVEARHIAIHGTQNMLMSLDHDDPITYLLDTVFGLSSKDAASVLEVSPDAYRQRLSRVRTKIEAFTYAHCALVNADAKCRCDRQIPAVRFRKTRRPGQPSLAGSTNVAESTEAEKNVSDFMKLMNAAAVFRAHPQYQASEAIIPATRHPIAYPRKQSAAIFFDMTPIRLISAPK
jgi:hypothetical protein